MFWVCCCCCLSSFVGCKGDDYTGMWDVLSGFFCYCYCSCLSSLFAKGMIMQVHKMFCISFCCCLSSLFAKGMIMQVRKMFCISFCCCCCLSSLFAQGMVIQVHELFWVSFVFVVWVVLLVGWWECLFFCCWLGVFVVAVYWRGCGLPLLVVCGEPGPIEMASSLTWPPHWPSGLGVCLQSGRSRVQILYATWLFNDNDATNSSSNNNNNRILTRCKPLGKNLTRWGLTVQLPQVEYTHRREQ